MLAGKHQERYYVQRLGGGGGGPIFLEEESLRHCVQNRLLDYGNETSY